MNLHVKLVTGLAALSLGLVPATGMAASPDYEPEGPVYTPGPEYDPSRPPKKHPNPSIGPNVPVTGKAYGRYCRGQSRKHVKGKKGTAFSRCVKAMARADRNRRLSARQACRALSKERVEGGKLTSFGRCVKGVQRMRSANP